MIAIIDYDIGNLNAVANMLRRIGVICLVTNTPEIVEAADHIILPGNGSYDACMRNLRDTGLIPLLEDRVLRNGVPLLGICVGAQILGTASVEGTEPGLGWLDMEVLRLPDIQGLRVPHMGWAPVAPTAEKSFLTLDLPKDSDFYFVHSYYMAPRNACDVALTAFYGVEFAAAVARQNIFGVQFHPEKSHRYGKTLFSVFAGVS